MRNVDLVEGPTKIVGNLLRERQIRRSRKHHEIIFRFRHELRQSFQLLWGAYYTKSADPSAKPCANPACPLRELNANMFF